MQTKGFALIEILDTCPTHYGRLNKFGDAAHMLEKVHNMTVPVEKAAKMTEEELEGKFAQAYWSTANGRTTTPAIGRSLTGWPPSS